MKFLINDLFYRNFFYFDAYAMEKYMMTLYTLFIKIQHLFKYNFNTELII